MKVVERIVEKLVRKVNIDDMQFGFMPGCGTTDAIFLVKQMQEMYLGKKKKLNFAFVDLKALDRVPCAAMHKLGVLRVVRAMYTNVRGCVMSRWYT